MADESTQENVEFGEIELYLLQVETDGVLSSGDRLQETRFSTEIELEVERFGPDKAGLRVTRLVIASPGTLLDEGGTGSLSIQGLGEEQRVFLEGNEWELGFEFKASIAYEQIGQEVGYEQYDEHVYVTPPETFLLALSGMVLSADEKPILVEGRIHLAREEGIVGAIDSADIVLPDTELINLTRLSSGKALYNPCHPNFKQPVMMLKIQPVGFSTGPGDPAPTGPAGQGNPIDDQFKAAKTIWQKASIELDQLKTIVITDAQLKTSADTLAIKSACTPANQCRYDWKTIVVFCVDNPLAAVGGGATYDPGLNFAKVVIDNQSPNANLLAHELGHVLAGCHPTGCTTGSLTPKAWMGDPDTVLEPNVMNPAENTFYNCFNARKVNPALTTQTRKLQCLKPDIPDHFIRRFPEDQGEEPAQLPAQRDLDSASYLWNRQTDDPGFFLPDGQPAHQHPVRRNLDNTPYKNFLFVRVERKNPLKLRNVQVLVYMKPINSPAGPGQAQLIGSIDIDEDDLLNLAVTTTRIPWNVPAGTPEQSCLFAVVRSPAEPEESIANYDFAGLQVLVKADNDWVQRRIKILDVVP